MTNDARCQGVVAAVSGTRKEQKRAYKEAWGRSVEEAKDVGWSWR